MLKMLIVDDEETTVNFLKDFFERERFEVRTVLSGEAAVEDVEKNSPHLILLDMQMAGINGIQTLKLIKQKIPNQRKKSPVKNGGML